MHIKSDHIKPEPEVQALIDALVECRHWVAYLDDVHGTNIITTSAIKMADEALAPFRPTIWERMPVIENPAV